MIEKHYELLKMLIHDELSESDIEPQLAPGCELYTATEEQPRLSPGKPVETWTRVCSKIIKCDDPNNNADWVCRPWKKKA